MKNFLLFILLATVCAAQPTTPINNARLGGTNQVISGATLVIDAGATLTGASGSSIAFDELSIGRAFFLPLAPDANFTAAPQALWLSSTTTNKVKYRAGTTTYTLLNSADIGTAVQAWSTALDTFATNGSTYYLNLSANHAGTLQAAQFPALTGDITTTAGSLTTAIGAAKVTNAMLAGSIAATKLVGTDITSLANLATIGTIGTGTWQAGVIAGQYGGTGVANTGKTITLGGNLTTSGAFATTLTATALTSVTLPTSGTLATVAGTVPAWSGLTTNGLLQATSATAVASTLTPSGLTSLGVNSITAASATDLTLNAGSGNQNVVLTPTGTGYIQTPNLRVFGSQINESLTNANAAISINLSGYAGGTTQYRDLMVYNGKAGQIFSLTGSNAAAVFGGAVTINSTTASTSTTTGSLINAGGFGNAGAIYAGGDYTRTGAAATFRGFAINTTTTSRWYLSADSTAESGSNAGSNFSIRAYDDAGTLIDIPLTLVRAASGSLTINRPASVTNTTSASASNVGAFLVGNGTAATNVAIGGGNINAGGTIIGGIQALSGAGAVNVTTQTTALTTSGVAQALTLANGTAGQTKTIIHDVDGGSAVLTPTTKTGFSTVTFNNAGDTVTLQYLTTRGWFVLSSYGAVVAP